MSYTTYSTKKYDYFEKNFEICRFPVDGHADKLYSFSQCGRNEQAQLPTGNAHYKARTQTARGNGEPIGEEQMEEEISVKATNYFYITEILNDLHRNGFDRGGKAETMLVDWKNEIQHEGIGFPKTKQKQVHAKRIGGENW